VKRPIVSYGPVYAVTPSTPMSVPALVAAVDAALSGGVRLVQWRRKGEGIDPRAGLFEVRERCRAAGAIFLVNDDVELAVEARADGVHVGRDDADPDSARSALGPDAYVGVSCYASIDSARRAAAQGADYVAFGSVFPSPTKPQAPRCPLATLDVAARELTVPVCAIGGIGRAELPVLRAHGVALAAVVSALFDPADTGIATRAAALVRAAGSPAPPHTSIERNDS